MKGNGSKAPFPAATWMSIQPTMNAAQEVDRVHRADRRGGPLQHDLNAIITVPWLRLPAPRCPMARVLSRCRREEETRARRKARRG